MALNCKEHDIERLKKIYQEIKHKLVNRLLEFKQVFIAKNKHTIFSELVFCLLTPQSKARRCWACVVQLMDKGLLFSGSEQEVLKEISGVRFKYKKASYIVMARRLFDDLFAMLFSYERPIVQKRKWLVKNIKGLGYKESSHFLRNIGLGNDIAILDRHILKNLNRFGVIKDIPSTLSKNRYLEIEERMRLFSLEVGIPMDQLDLLLWYLETKEVFK